MLVSTLILLATAHFAAAGPIKRNYNASTALTTSTLSSTSKLSSTKTTANSTTASTLTPVVAATASAASNLTAVALSESLSESLSSSASASAWALANSTTYTATRVYTNTSTANTVYKTKTKTKTVHKSNTPVVAAVAAATSADSVASLATSAVYQIETTAVTNTHTIYVASSSPSADAATTSLRTVSISSLRDPLITEEIVTTSLSVTLTRTHFTTRVVASVSSSETYTASESSSDSDSSSSDSSSSDSGFTYSNYTFSNTSLSDSKLFAPISQSAPLSVFKRSQLPLDLPANVENDRPFQTNKFSTNLILANQSDMIWSYPYGLFLEKTNMFGWGVSYAQESERVFGVDSKASVTGTDYFTLPADIAGMLFSAEGFSSGMTVKVSNQTDMSVVVSLSAAGAAATGSNGTSYIEIPTVLGQGFISAVYHGSLKAVLKSSSGIKSFSEEKSSALSSNTRKYRATLFSGQQWLVYVSGDSSVDFSVSNSQLVASKASDGLIVQVALSTTSGKSSMSSSNSTSYFAKFKNATNGSGNDNYYDVAAGAYLTGATLTGEAANGYATYGFKYSFGGKSKSGKPIVFALPHQVQSLTAETAKGATGISLDSTTKGAMYAFVTDELLMDESLETQVQFAPWSQDINGSVSWTKEQLKLISTVANEELQTSVKDSISNISTYSAGKILDRYAYLLYTVSDVLQDEAMTATTLQNMKDAFQVFLDNKQRFPLMYDTKYGGVSTTANNYGDSGEDYGAGYYNDHHFHYGYFVHAAAVLGYVDSKKGNGTWVSQNKDWVNSLVRDVANPSAADKYFPVSRMFDWYSGHSWASGLFTSGAGRNEESSSEDYNFAYGMKLWGKVSKQSAMESRGDLMIAVMKRSLNNYFLYSSDNAIVPDKIKKNMVSGIFFENKIAYTTFFGTKPEYIHGIHMVPITPVSSVIRSPSYAKSEWDSYFSSTIDTIDSGWTGVLRLNQALFDPKSSYEFFSQDSFKNTWLDNGQSRTWCLVYSGALANGAS